MVDFIHTGDSVEHLNDADRERYEKVSQFTDHFLDHLMAHAQQVGHGDITALVEAHLAASFNAIVTLTTSQEGETRAHLEDQFKKAFLLYAEHLEMQPGPSKGVH